MSWDDAYAEALASAPKNVIILPTLELRHPSFVDADGNFTPVRVVRDYGDAILDGGGNPIVVDDVPLFGWKLTLEGDAPANPGETVVFQQCMFNLTTPGQDQQRLPEIPITIDNVAHIVSKYLDDAVEIREQIGVTYREYITTDTSHPRWILTGLNLARAKTTLLGVTGTASFKDLINKSFPGYLYRRNEYTGLSGISWQG
jgi:hypothetical protein